MKKIFILICAWALVGCSSESKKVEAEKAPEAILTMKHGTSVLAPDEVNTPKSKKRASEAFMALKNILKNYASGDTAAVEAQIDTRMVGLAQLMDQMRQSSSVQKNIDIVLQEPRYTKSRQVYVVNVEWQKRYNQLPNMNTQLVSGQSTFMFQHIDKKWKMSSLSGDNPFAL